MLFGASPGGGLSNIISQWFGCDTDLSLTMTMLSSILALGSRVRKITQRTKV